MSRKGALATDASRLIAGQEALADFGRYALHTDNLDELLSAACEQVARGLGVPMAKVAVVVPGNDTLLLKAAVGVPPSAGIPGVTTLAAGEGSAMGYTLQVKEPVLSTIDTETRFAPSEVVRKSGVRSSANVVIWAGDEPYGSLEADSPEPDVFGAHDLHFLQLYANLLGAAVERQSLSQRAEALARERELLLRESVHRVKNILSVVHAVAWRTRKDAVSVADFLQLFIGRINALSRLQEVTLRAGENPVRIAELARAELGASGAREGEHYWLDGPEFDCSPDIAQALGLLFHELTTNACKYGALSPKASPNARIELCWRAEPGPPRTDFEVRWQERGGVPQVPSDCTGFGSELLKSGVARMLSGTVEMRMHNDGVDCITRFSRENWHIGD